MSKPRKPTADPALTEPGGMSLDQLSLAFAAMLGEEKNASAPPLLAVDPDTRLADDESDAPAASRSTWETAEQSDPAGTVGPRTILEAALFVGRPDNVPLSSAQIANLMRGVSSEEIDEHIRELNARYAANGCPYEIASDGEGYRFVLREAFGALRARFFGRIRAARLSPAAIEVLALVAYNEPLTSDDVSRLRGTPSGHILAQLVRRQLLRLERPGTRPRKAKYSTTRRFLQVFSLSSLDDLPRSEDLERQ